MNVYGYESVCELLEHDGFLFRILANDTGVVLFPHTMEHRDATQPGFDMLKSRKGMQSQGSGSRFRFGIRSLLVVVLVSAIGLAIYVPLKHRHQTIHCGNASSKLNSAITTN